jgi:CheY-like chemotaxis protein
MPKTLLIADDDAVLLKTLQNELSARGYSVVTATNGLMAVQQAKKFKPHLIILDVAMPMTSGLKAYDSIRATPETRSTPVIFLSGLPSKDVYPTVEQGTRVAHLKKPVDFDDLLSVIQEFLPAQ